MMLLNKLGESLQLGFVQVALDLDIPSAASSLFQLLDKDRDISLVNDPQEVYELHHLLVLPLSERARDHRRFHL